MRLRHSSILITALALAGCVSARYAYVPAGVSGLHGDHSKHGKAYYTVPPDAPEGTVRTMSAGVVKLKPDNGGAKIPALHLKMELSNQTGKQPWTLDVAEQSVSFPDEPAAVRPALAQSNAPKGQPVSVSEGELRAVDLYFPLPQRDKSARDVPDFDFHWQLHAGARLVQDTTSFDRVAIDDTYYGGAYYGYPGPYYGPGWGPGWGFGYGWMGPPAMIVAPAPAMPPPRPVIVH